MLYDKKWDRFSLDNFIEWMEKQPKNKKYDFGDSLSCALAQWLKSNSSNGIIDYGDGSSFSYKIEGREYNFEHFRKIVAMEPHKFGAAIERARNPNMIVRNIDDILGLGAEYVEH
jgi:hypothetical protein